MNEMDVYHLTSSCPSLVLHSAASFLMKDPSANQLGLLCCRLHKAIAGEGGAFSHGRFTLQHFCYWVVSYIGSFGITSVVLIYIVDFNTGHIF